MFMISAKKTPVKIASLRAEEELVSLNFFSIFQLLFVTNKIPFYFTKARHHKTSQNYAQIKKEIGRVAKCHGYGKYIRVKKLESYGKKSGKTHSFAKSSTVLGPFQQLI